MLPLLPKARAAQHWSQMGKNTTQNLMSYDQITQCWKISVNGEWGLTRVVQIRYKRGHDRWWNRKRKKVVLEYWIIELMIEFPSTLWEWTREEDSNEAETELSMPIECRAVDGEGMHMNQCMQLQPRQRIS